MKKESTSKFYVAMTKNGELLVMRPMFFLRHESALGGASHRYSIFMIDTGDPDGYALDMNQPTCPIVGKEIIKHVEVLGEL